MDDFDAGRNPDGTYHLGRVFESLTNGKISSAEIMWMANRLKHLMHVEKKTKDEAKAIVKEEARTKPWEST